MHMTHKQLSAWLMWNVAHDSCDMKHITHMKLSAWLMWNVAHCSCDTKRAFIQVTPQIDDLIYVKQCYTGWSIHSTFKLDLRYMCSWFGWGSRQWRFFSRNIAYVTPKIIYFYYQKYIFFGSKYPKIKLIKFEKNFTEKNSPYRLQACNLLR